MQITRELRIFLRSGTAQEKCHNTWSGWNCGMEIAPWIGLRLTVEGPVSKETGYLCDIRTLDNAIRETVQELTRQETASGEPRYDSLASRIFRSIPSRLPPPISPVRLELAVSPQLSLTVTSEYPAMILWTQQSEFSASHRLHCPDLSDEENRQLFGKCNNPAGHGHNYVVQITLRCETANGKMKEFSPQQFEQLISESVIQRLDHKNLNIDLPEFAGLNPSVENIASLIWAWLENKFQPNQLHNVRVYETPKTWADCTG